MDSANSTIPLRGLQYIASPEPSYSACRNRLHQKINMTNIAHNQGNDKYNTTLPVLNNTQCHGTRVNEHREIMSSAKCKEKCDMMKEKEENFCTVDDDNHVSSANKSTHISNFGNSKEFAKTLSRFSESTRQMLNLNKSHNTSTLSQSSPHKIKCCSNSISETELHNFSDEKVNSKVNRIGNNKEDTTLTNNNMKGSQYKNNTMPIVTRKTDMHSYSLSMSNAMKTLPLRQTCRDYCFTSLSTILSRHYATPSHHYPSSSTIGHKEQRKINVCKDNNNNNINKNNAHSIVDDSNTNKITKCNNVDTELTHRYSNTIGTSKQFESTLMRKAGNVPPLVITLRSHIQRELDCIAHRKFNPDKVTSATGVVDQGNSNMDCGNSYTTKAGQTLYRVAVDENDSVHHEMSDNNCSEMCVVDQLLPYREALVALRSALPGYEQLLEEIQVAYDKVIEAQAELLTDAYAKEAIKEFTSEEQREEALRLRQQVNDLTTTLNKMRVELEARRRLAAEAEDEDGDEYDGSASNNVNNGVNYSSSTSAVVGNVALKKGVNRSRSALAKARSDFFEATQKLQLAQQRITKLEQNSKGDLEKILVLIGAVRECDRRLKSYEQTVKTMSGQIEELDEFKRLAAEAQAELQRYKERYECFVALGDFDLMRQHLTDELASSQAMSRRLRRTAAVRGTQVEVMQRRLNTLEEELATLRSNGVNSSMQEMTLASTTEKRLSSTQLLTPRPNWAAVHRKMHEMAEETKPIFCFPLPHICETNKSKEEPVLSDNVNNMPHGTVNNDTTTTTRINDNVIHTSDTNTSEKLEALPIKNDEKGTNVEDDELLVVDAAKETSSQVDLLVNHIIYLQRQVEELSTYNTFYQMCMQKWFALPERLSTLPVDKVGKNNGIANSLHSHRNFGHEPSSDTTTTTVTAKVNNILPATPENMKNAVNILEPYFANSELSKRLESMQSAWILGPGVESQIPAYLRVSGCVERIVVAPKTRCRLIFNFFTEILQPLFSEPYNSKSALAELFATFLESQIEEEASLTQFACNAHLALNLEMDCHTHSLNNPPLLLLFNILNYRMPVRLAIDAVEVVSHAMSDITALAKEQRKARLRRGAISECLTLLLELMTTGEIAELRVALGEELTFDAVALASIDSRFMRTLFYQSCQSSMDLYTNLIQKLTLRSSTVVNEENIRNQVISTRDVAEIILAVEPRTPEIVIRELTENALKSCMQSDETTANDDMLTSTIETNLYLSEVIKAVGEAPIIRRSAQSLKDDCNL